MSKELVENEVFNLLRQKDVLLQAGCIEEVKLVDISIMRLQAAHGPVQAKEHQGATRMEAKELEKELENSTSEDTEIQSACEKLRGTVEATFDLLIQRRDAAYSNAIGALEIERGELEQEAATIEADAQNIEGLLESKARVSLYEADCLKLAGDFAGAAKKLAEQKEAESAPEVMRTRQGEITNRIQAIVEEKRACARRVFEPWHGECQSVIRVLEEGLFVKFLHGLWDEYLNFESRTCPQRNLSETPMIRSGHRNDLTADENSELWAAGTKWYSGRERR